jgi:anti-sigma factor RsiW
MTGPSDTAKADPLGREDLVAYLDGELDAEAARRLEERLRTDDTLRNELHRLERTWDMLATLPSTEADASLTKSTVEMLALETEEDVACQAATRLRRRRLAWATAAAMLFLAGLLGTRLAAAVWPDPDDPLLRDLHVVQQRDPYYQAGSVEFLRSLRQRGLFVSDDEHHQANTP